MKIKIWCISCGKMTTAELIESEGYLASGDTLVCDDCQAKISVEFGLDEEGKES